MKKIFFSLLSVLAFAFVAQAQINIPINASTNNSFISNVPSFGFSDPIKLIVDVSGVPVLKAEVDANKPIYIWAFIGSDAPTNGQWLNSNEANRMTQVGAAGADKYKWSIVIPSVKEFVAITYNQAKQVAVAAGRPETATRLGFLVKGKNGDGGIKSGDIEIPFVGPVYIPTETRTFPANYSQEDVVTIIYDQNLEDNAAMKASTTVYLYIEGDINGNNTIPVSQANVGTSTTPSMRMIDKGNKMFTYTFVPNRFFTIPAGQRLTKIRYTVRSQNDQNINGGQKVSNLFRAQ
ncbi:MAG: hypothetical protein EAZ85_02310 [Bacteroidetes bacterium]|nr:MAG: hypothetical protein EAZ85_02310 [Bacteroidota bacterium]